MTRVRYYQYILEYVAHLANFNEKVHKPQSKSCGRIGANMQLIFTHILNLNISIFAS